MRVLVIGGGGREHAIVHKLASSSAVGEIIAAPGNGGTASLARNVSLDAENAAAVASFAEDARVDLVVVGPEAPLVGGVVDAVAARGIRVFGPTREAARIEGSKAFAKSVMVRHGVPTGGYATFTEEEPALAYLESRGAPVVVKADGLAAGKGVTVATELAEARTAVREALGGRFGAAGSTVLVEEFLDGPECSLLAFTDGETVIPMVPAQDHKRVYDNDEGPNTGGMGVYTPVPVVSEADLRAMTAMLEATVRGMAADGIPYAGVLYGGFIMTSEGPKVLEFNARFGDPETQVILPRMDSDLLDVMLAVAEKRLAGTRIRWNEDAVVSVVLASGGYPGDYEVGREIAGIAAAEAVDGVTVYHAGTVVEGDRVLTAGGRVLNVTAAGSSFDQARTRAYHAIEHIRFEGMHYRTDIGLKALAALGESA